MVITMGNQIEIASTDKTPDATSLVYGIHPVADLIHNRPNAVDRVYFAQGRQSGSLFALLKECRRRRIPYHVVPSIRLERLAPRASHQGVVAVCTAKPYADFSEVLSSLRISGHVPLVLVVASVTDPRNMGAIVRSAVAFGVDAVLVERNNTASLSEGVAKSAAGLLERAVVSRPRSLEAAVQELKEIGLRVIAAELGSKTAPWDLNLREPLALVVGGEHRSIPPYLLKLADTRVTIPLIPEAASLNVSAAASILLYECARQRWCAGTT